jgi:hypothetical protein
MLAKVSDPTDDKLPDRPLTFSYTGKSSVTFCALADTLNNATSEADKNADLNFIMTPLVDTVKRLCCK